MKHLVFNPNWPESWKFSYPYDQMEIYGEKWDKGYSCAYDNRRRQTIDLVRKVANPGAKILDVAAAQGNFTLSLAEMGYEVTWNDLRGDLADYVRLKHEKGVVYYAPGNVFEMNFNSLFDVVLITEIIEHVAHPDEFLSKIAELVKPGGHIIMSTPNGGYFINRLPKFSNCRDPSQFESMHFKPTADGHIFLLHTDEIPVLAKKAGVEVKGIRLFSNALTSGHMKTSPLLNILPLRIVNRIERISQLLPTPLSRKLHSGMSVLFKRPI